MPILFGTIASSNQQARADTGVMFPLGAITVGSAGASTITFSSIPATYTHLQIRGISRNTGTNSDGTSYFNFNGDGSSNYTIHYLQANGSSTSATGIANTSGSWFGDTPGTSTSSNIFAESVIDILDYANTNKFKTFRSLTGYDANGSGKVSLYSGLWRSTSAIDSVVLVQNAGNFAQNSQFALYGIKGA
jgi:hypothetical protein